MITPLAGVNLWPRLSGSSSTPPRKELFGGPNFLISGDYKLLLGEAVTYAVWTGPQSPNATTDATKQFFLQWNCSECQPPVTMGRINCSKGCLCAHSTDETLVSPVPCSALLWCHRTVDISAYLGLEQVPATIPPLST